MDLAYGKKMIALEFPVKIWFALLWLGREDKSSFDLLMLRGLS